MNNHVEPDQWLVIYLIFILSGFVVIACGIKAWWWYRIWRKELQITSMRYRGIPVDIGKGKKR